MRLYEAVSVGFLLYVAILALRMKGLAVRRRVLACAGAAIGIAFILMAYAVPHPAWVDDWVLPPILLPVAYWTSGLLFIAPMPLAERTLRAIDRHLGVRELAGCAPRWIAELLEFAYIGVYPLLPIALALHLTTAEVPSASRFWTVMLITGYACYGVLPWVQTRPPRALEPEPPWPARFRNVNLRLSGAASIGVNTFPSAHAAGALAAALLVATAPWPIFASMLLVAAAIWAGAVFGRYHYAADALAGNAVAVGVWMLLG